MRAVQIDRFDEPSEVVKVVKIPVAPLAADEIRVQIETAGINPSAGPNLPNRLLRATLPHRQFVRRSRVVASLISK
jgi:hypothetical protein